MKFRIIEKSMPKKVHYCVQYRHWFIWHDVLRKDGDMTLYFSSLYDAKDYINDQSYTVKIIEV